MKTQTLTNISGFIGQLSRPEKGDLCKDNLLLGKTFTGNIEIMKIVSLLSGEYSNGKNTNKAELDTKDPATRFYVFTLLFRQYFNDHSKKTVPAFEEKIDVLATALSIDKTDRIQVTEFFMNEEAYTDKKNAVYFNNKKTTSVKYIGANIMYAASRNNEIVYLKYFKNYNVFLSKKFVKNKDPYFFIDNVPASEINVLNQKNYFMEDYGYNTFEEIVDSVKNHKPFQYFEMAATANTPKIVLDPEEGKLVICGSSSPFSPTNFFAPILEWFENYRALGKGPLQVFIMLDYFNTYTSKFLLRLCRQCDVVAKEGKDIKVYWYFDPEDNDMREFGEHLNGIYKKGFEYCLITDGVEEIA